MDKTGEDWSGLQLDKFEKRRPTFFQIYVWQFIDVSNFHKHSWKIILSCYVAIILTLGLPIWRLELTMSKTKQNYLK